MRNFIDAVLNEKWDKTLEDGTDIFRNPSKIEFIKLAYENDGECRLSFTRDGDILVFDPNVTTHEDLLAPYAGEIDGDYPTALVGRRPNGSNYIMLHHAYSFSDDYINDIVPDFRNNKNLVKMLGVDFDILAEKDDGETVNLAWEPYKN